MTSKMKRVALFVFLVVTVTCDPVPFNLEGSKEITFDGYSDSLEFIRVANQGVSEPSLEKITCETHSDLCRGQIVNCVNVMYDGIFTFECRCENGFYLNKSGNCELVDEMKDTDYVMQGDEPRDDLSRN